jgi:hypothetical protein
MDAPENPLNFHREIYVSDRTGLPIHVACYCGIRADHGFDEWLQLYADDKWQLRYAANIAAQAAAVSV